MTGRNLHITNLKTIDSEHAHNTVKDSPERRPWSQPAIVDIPTSDTAGGSIAGIEENEFNYPSPS